MCRYIVVRVRDDESTASLKAGDCLAFRNDYEEACKYAEAQVIANNETLEIFERITTVRPTTTAQFQGRRRPGVGA